jgi:hypothetical protein
MEINQGYDHFANFTLALLCWMIKELGEYKKIIYIINKKDNNNNNNKMI